MRILVETAGDDLAIPRHDTPLPHSPTFILECVSNLPDPSVCSVVSAEFRCLREQWMAIAGVIDLSRLDDQLIDACFAGLPFDLGQFVFIWPHDQKLPNEVRTPSSVLAPRFDHVARAFKYLFQLSPNPIRGIGLLCHAVDADDQATQSRPDNCIAAFRPQKVSIGGGGGINAAGVCHGYQFV